MTQYHRYPQMIRINDELYRMMWRSLQKNYVDCTGDDKVGFLDCNDKTVVTMTMMSDDDDRKIWDLLIAGDIFTKRFTILLQCFIANGSIVKGSKIAFEISADS